MAKLLVLTLALALLPTLARAQDHPPDPAFRATTCTFLALTALDTSQSLRAFSTQRGREGNVLIAPLSSSPAAFTALQAGAATLEAYGLTRLRRTHPKTAWGFLVGVTALKVVIVVRNAQVMR